MYSRWRVWVLRPAAGRNKRERERAVAGDGSRHRESREMSQSRADTRSSESPGPWHQTWSQLPASGRDGTIIILSLHSPHPTRLRTTHAMTSATSTSSSPRPCLFSLAEAAGTSRGAQQLTSATSKTRRPRDRRGPPSIITPEAPWPQCPLTTLTVTPRHLTPETIITMSRSRIPRHRQFVFRVVSFWFLVKHSNDTFTES